MAVSSAVKAPTPQRILPVPAGKPPTPALQVFHRISSFEKKPAKGTMPQMASQPVTIVAKVMGMYRFKPPMRRMSCS